MIVFILKELGKIIEVLTIFAYLLLLLVFCILIFPVLFFSNASRNTLPSSKLLRMFGNLSNNISTDFLEYRQNVEGYLSFYTNTNYILTTWLANLISVPFCYLALLFTPIIILKTILNYTFRNLIYRHEFEEIQKLMLSVSDENPDDTGEFILALRNQIDLIKSGKLSHDMYISDEFLKVRKRFNRMHQEISLNNKSDSGISIQINDRIFCFKKVPLHNETRKKQILITECLPHFESIFNNTRAEKKEFNEALIRFSKKLKVPDQIPTEVLPVEFSAMIANFMNGEDIVDESNDGSFKLT